MPTEPRLLCGGLTGKAYIATRYTTLPDGLIQATTKYEVRPRDLLEVVARLPISKSALDEVAKALGFSPTEEDNDE